MDYESRKVKWYWLLLFMIYCVWVVNLLFKGNPLLYSRADLRTSLNGMESAQRQTIPLHPAEGKLSAPTYFARYNWQRTAIDPLGSPRTKNYSEYARYPVAFGGQEKFTVQTAVGDASGFYLTDKDRWVVALSLDGAVRWKYRFKDTPGEHDLFPILLDETSAYLVHPGGEVVCLDKMTGDLHWLLWLKEEVVAAPLLWKKNLVVPTKAGNQVQMTLVDRLNGRVNEDSPHLEIKPDFQLSESSDLDVMIATVDNKVIAIEPDDWQVQWSQTVTDPIKGPAMNQGGQIYVTTLGAKVVKLDGSRKGKMEWEADLIKPPASAPTYIPMINRLAVMDTSGAVSVIDAKTGKVNVRYGTENRNPLAEVWAARLKGQYIEEFKMDWLHKGWTIWAPCSESAYCIYTPNKGQLISRIPLSGRPLTLPVVYGRHWVFLTRNKAGQYVVSHNFEESEIKKLHAAAP